MGYKYKQYWIKETDYGWEVFSLIKLIVVAITATEKEAEEYCDNH